MSYWKIDGQYNNSPGFSMYESGTVLSVRMTYLNETGADLTNCYLYVDSENLGYVQAKRGSDGAYQDVEEIFGSDKCELGTLAPGETIVDFKIQLPEVDEPELKILPVYLAHDDGATFVTVTTTTTTTSTSTTSTSTTSTTTTSTTTTSTSTTSTSTTTTSTTTTTTTTSTSTTTTASQTTTTTTTSTTTSTSTSTSTTTTTTTSTSTTTTAYLGPFVDQLWFDVDEITLWHDVNEIQPWHPTTTTTTSTTTTTTTTV